MAGDAVVDETAGLPHDAHDAAHDDTRDGAAPAPGETPPLSATEALLADIWRQVLDVEAVGPEDDFFRLGGQSLLAVQVAVRVRDALDVDLLLPRLFELRTLSAVAAELDASQGHKRTAPLIERRPAWRGPLSIAQRSMLALRGTELVPTVAPVFRIVGPLDVRALEGALNELVRRHEILRTVYRTSLGRDRQVVLPWSPVPLSMAEPGGKQHDRKGFDPRQVVADNIVSPFDIDTGPVIRWRLVRLGKQEHLLSIAIHEIAADGWSVPVLAGELSALYSDLAAGRAPSLPEPAVQYLDFVRWQRARVTRRVRRRQLDYWKARLGDAPLALDLVADQWPDAFDAPVPRAAELRLDRTLVDDLRELARDEGATLFMVLLAALQALVHRYTGSPEVVLRPTFANRTTAQVEGIPGFFVNFLLLDTDVSGDPSFGELVERARRDLLDATVHADVQLADVLNRVARMRTGRTQWPAGKLRFQLFNFPNNAGLRLDGLRVDREKPSIPESHHFSMAGTENTDGSVTFVLHYDGSLFGRTAMERLLDRYESVLEQVVDSPGARISSLALLDRRDEETVRRAGRGAVAGAAPASIVGSLGEEARRNGDAVAVASTAGALTYRELADWATRVSARVRTEVAPEAPVVLLAAPGPALVAGLLGLLDSGALCVPVDPSLPKDVVEAIVQHAQPVAVVAEEATASRVPKGHTPLLLDDLRSTAPNGHTLGSQAPATDAAALAVYGYGRKESPRAAVLTHGALAQAAAWHRSAHNLRRTDRVTELPGCRLGRLASAVLPTLLAGGAYVVADESTAPFDWLRDQRITVCIGDAPVLKACMGATAELAKAPLRLLVCDEPIAAAEGRQRFQVVEQFPLAECAGAWAVADRLRSPGAPAFAGAPTGGVEAFVVDASTNLAPPLVPGELCLSGARVARGYLHDPRETAQVFVPDPFADHPGARMVRTGLVARVDARQRIEVLGAAGRDWSARGLPLAVYLRRIEGALRAHPAVGSVLAKVEHVLREPRVAVYVVPCLGMTVKQRELRALLPSGLPAVARPFVIEVLDRFPRRPDGRIDETALGRG